MAVQFTNALGAFRNNFGAFATSDDDLWITEPDYVLTNGGIAFDFGSFSDNEYAVEGSVYSDDFNDDGPASGFDAIFSNGTNHQVNVRPTGTVSGAEDGVQFGIDVSAATGSSNDPQNNGTGNKIVNEGSIMGRNGSGVLTYGGGTRV